MSILNFRLESFRIFLRSEEHSSDWRSYVCSSEFGQYEIGAREMATALAAAAAGFNSGGDMLVLSHAVYISYLALALVDALAEQKERQQEQQAVVDEWRAAARAVILPVNVGEVCCFEISDSGCRYLPNPLATDFASASSNDAYILGGGGGE